LAEKAPTLSAQQLQVVAADGDVAPSFDEDLPDDAVPAAAAAADAADEPQASSSGPGRPKMFWDDVHIMVTQTLGMLPSSRIERDVVDRVLFMAARFVVEGELTMASSQKPVKRWSSEAAKRSTSPFRGEFLKIGNLPETGSR
jgi:hypothetical protein